MKVSMFGKIPIKNASRKPPCPRALLIGMPCHEYNCSSPSPPIASSFFLIVNLGSVFSVV